MRAAGDDDHVEQQDGDRHPEGDQPLELGHVHNETSGRQNNVRGLFRRDATRGTGRPMTADVVTTPRRRNTPLSARSLSGTPQRSTTRPPRPALARHQRGLVSTVVATPEIPAQYLLSDHAPAPRTLIDILYDTAARYPGRGGHRRRRRSQLTYSELIADIEDSVEWLGARGIGRGDRIGIRMPSGSYALYVAILSTLAAGAAYVPVDADDPDERAELVFGEADVVGVITEAGLTRGPGSSRGWRATAPLGRDDAWIIFTSGLDRNPEGRRGDPPQRGGVRRRRGANVLAGQSDRARRPGAGRAVGGLRRLLRGDVAGLAARRLPGARTARRWCAAAWTSGRGWSSRDITVVSTVPTLAALWPAEALEAVRLLIFGGEACPPELAERLAVEGREVWNTYGPTEATVVACAARLDGHSPVSIGLPLPGLGSGRGRRGRARRWPSASVGELVIGGVGLARYLDPEKDAEKYAPMPSLGWARAYRSGDLVRLEPDGLYFQGRADDQVKVGGRRIELGEVDSALVHLPGVSGGAAAVRRTASGTPMLVGYIASADPDFDLAAARAHLAEALPAALVPRLVLVDELPTRTSGKVDRDALPWPPPGLPGRRTATSAARWAGWPGCGATSWARWSTGRRPTSSPSAAARCRRPSWWPRCAPATRS